VRLLTGMSSASMSAYSVAQAQYRIHLEKGTGYLSKKRRRVEACKENKVCWEWDWTSLFAKNSVKDSLHEQDRSIYDMYWVDDPEKWKYSNTSGDQTKLDSVLIGSVTLCSRWQNLRKTALGWLAQKGSLKEFKPPAFSENIGFPIKSEGMAPSPPGRECISLPMKMESVPKTTKETTLSVAIVDHRNFQPEDLVTTINNQPASTSGPVNKVVVKDGNKLLHFQMQSKDPDFGSHDFGYVYEGWLIVDPILKFGPNPLSNYDYWLKMNPPTCSFGPVQDPSTVKCKKKEQDPSTVDSQHLKGGEKSGAMIKVRCVVEKQEFVLAPPEFVSRAAWQQSIKYPNGVLGDDTPSEMSSEPPIKRRRSTEEEDELDSTGLSSRHMDCPPSLLQQHGVGA